MNHLTFFRRWCLRSGSSGVSVRVGEAAENNTMAKPLDVSGVDTWPLTEAGLPVRVVNAATRNRLQTVGDLREALRRRGQPLHGLGKASCAEALAYLALCEGLRAGTVALPDVPTVLARFLTPPERNVIDLRYGLRDDPRGPTPDTLTLAEVGAQLKVTRERVRQIEHAARTRLSCRLAQACLAPAYDFFEAFVRAHGHAVTALQVTELRGAPCLAPLAPTALLNLLCDCSPRLTAVQHVYTTAPAAALAHTLALLRRRLAGATGPQPLARLLEGLDLAPLQVTAEAETHIVRLLLQHTPDISATLDDRYFLPPYGAAELIAEILRRHPAPQHYLAVLRAYNTAVYPGSRKGTGFVLEHLQDPARFVKTADGLYAGLAPAAAPGGRPA